MKSMCNFKKRESLRSRGIALLIRICIEKERKRDEFKEIHQERERDEFKEMHQERERENHEKGEETSLRQLYKP